MSLTEQLRGLTSRMCSKEWDRRKQEVGETLGCRPFLAGVTPLSAVHMAPC